MSRLAGIVVSSLLLASIFASTAAAQTVVYNNQANLDNSAITTLTGNTEWDDLQIVGGGLLSERSLLAVSGSGAPQFASGFFDLRVFDELGNFPQGQSLGTIPFNGTFPVVPAGAFNNSILISMTGLESLGIALPHNTRLGVGVNFNQAYALIPSGPPTVGSSSGGNWLGASTMERFEFNDGLPYRLVVADPEPSGPGVGSYNVFETALATPNDPGGSSGIGTDEGFFTGIGFRVERTTHLSQVGGYMSGTGTIFAAIVQTEGLYALPNPYDLSGDDVLATTLLELPGVLDDLDVVGEIDVTLEPGT